MGIDTLQMASSPLVSFASRDIFRQIVSCYGCTHKNGRMLLMAANIWGSARENWAFAIFFKFSNLTVFGYRIALSTKQFLRIHNWTVYHRATKR